MPYHGVVFGLNCVRIITDDKNRSGVNDLTLEVGESYSFRVTYEPEDPSFHALRWNISDDSVVEIDPAHFTVKALSPGTARILAESLDGYAYDICTVTVSGNLPKDAIAAAFSFTVCFIV